MTGHAVNQDKNRALKLVWGISVLVSVTSGARPTLGAMVDISLVAVSTPSASDTVSTLPDTLTGVSTGASFHVEVWAQTLDGNGLTSVSADISFDPGQATVAGVTFSPIFSELQNGWVDNSTGMIDDLSGSHLGPCTDAIGVTPTWARLATIEMTAIAEGVISIGSHATDALPFGSSVCGVGDVDGADVSFGAITVAVGTGIPAASAWCLVVLGLLILITGSAAALRQSVPPRRAS